jgi:hypothetical protein
VKSSIKGSTVAMSPAGLRGGEQFRGHIPGQATVLELWNGEPADEKVAADIPANVVAGLGADATGACVQDPEEHSIARRPLHTDRQDGEG